MTRHILLGAASAVALSCLATGADAQAANTITGGGAGSTEFDYFVEFQTYNSAQSGSAATFANPSPATGNNILYWPSGAGSGQTAFLNDDISCDANKVTGAPGAGGVAGACSGTVGGTAAVSYAASDAALTTTQLAQWASSSVGQSVAGNLIQIPSLGVGLSFPVVNKTITKNGATAKNVAVAGGLVLTDNDLCGIFSGKITDWSGVTNFAKDKVTAGGISVVYRSDGSGQSFTLLNHLSAVCTSSNSNFPLPLNVSLTFAAAFPPVAGSNPVTYQVPANFVAQKSTTAVANYLSNTLPPGTGVNNVTSAIGYISPDYTTVDPMSNAFIGQDNPPDQKSTLIVAAVQNGAKVYIPTPTNIALGLNHATQGEHLTAPNGAGPASMPQNYVPVIQVTSQGYPVIAYGTFDFAQCYQNPLVAAGIISFMTNHYATAAYTSTEANNGFVTISKSGAKGFGNVINRAILSNAAKYNDNIQNTKVCTGKITGR